MCNSLLKMTDNITHIPEERGSKWYGAHDFERLLDATPVHVVPLSSIIEKYGLQDAVIHFLKIDAQGCDLEVLLSLGPYLKNCLFVQMELVSSGSRDLVLYEGQGVYEDERPIVESFGFDVFAEEDHGKLGASPEIDVVFINLALMSKLRGN
jgi:hypothetical protein